MTEFGHQYASGNGFHIDAWGAGPFVLNVRNKSFRFEDSDRFGPALICKDGELRKNPYPDEESPFWRAHYLWRLQGRRLAEDGITCVWDHAPEGNWPCACLKRDQSGQMTQIRIHLPSEKSCNECGCSKADIPFACEVVQ